MAQRWSDNDRAKSALHFSHRQCDNVGYKLELDNDNQQGHLYLPLNNRFPTMLIDKSVVEYVEQSPILTSFGTIQSHANQSKEQPCSWRPFFLYSMCSPPFPPAESKLNICLVQKYLDLRPTCHARILLYGLNKSPLPLLEHKGVLQKMYVYMFAQMCCMSRSMT